MKRDYVSIVSVILYAVFIMLAILTFLSCNSVKRVLNDQEKFDQVAKEVIRRGYCVNDTIIVTEVKDSIIYKDSITVITEKVPCKDFDTTIGRARIRVSSGVLFYTYKDSIVYRTKTIKETVRDRSLEGILKDDITKLQDSLKQARFESKECAADLKATKREARNDRVKLWLIIVALVTFAFRKQILGLVKTFI